MKIAAIADVHVGNHMLDNPLGGPLIAGVNSRGHAVLRVLEQAVRQAVEEGATKLFVAGDLMDSTRPTPQLLRGVQLALDVAEIDVHLLVGNHEQGSTEPGDHALTPLSPVVHRIYEHATASGDFAFVPYADCKSGLELLEAGLEGIDLGGDGVLVTHLGVRDGRTPPWLKNAHDCVDVSDLHALMGRCGAAVAILGNWHDHRYWRFDDGCEVIQCGALVPVGWSNPSTVAELTSLEEDTYGSLVIVDTALPRGSRVSRVVLPGPRFVQVGSVAKAQEAARIASERGVDLYVEVKASVDAKGEVLREVERLELAGSRVTVDQADVRKRVNAAALSARDQQTVERALAEYIERVPTEGADPAAVLRRCREYLAAAQG